MDGIGMSDDLSYGQCSRFYASDRNPRICSDYWETNHYECIHPMKLSCEMDFFRHVKHLDWTWPMSEGQWKDIIATLAERGYRADRGEFTVVTEYMMFGLKEPNYIYSSSKVVVQNPLLNYRTVIEHLNTIMKCNDIPLGRLLIFEGSYELVPWIRYGIIKVKDEGVKCRRYPATL